MIKIKKILDTLLFYYKKLVRVVDAVVESIVRSIEVIAAGIPKLIGSIYAIFAANINVNNIIALALAYIVYLNYAVLFSNPASLIIVLLAIILLLKK